MKKILIGIFLFVLCGITTTATAQRVGIKTNLLGWGTASPNLGMEIGLGKKSTLDVYGSVNPFRFGDGKQWKHWFVQPEYRFWSCEPFHGHFYGLHLIGGEYNIGNVKLPFGVYSNTREARYEGWGVGGGISYGYQWLLSRHWSLEGVIGVGYIYSRFEKYPCATCGKLLDSGSKNYFGPTKAAVNLIYVF